ncbi:SRPBCC family protein [Laceyella putida]|uniref:SRPBCC domain-containing protein n=1 Tax=Laceyella putida TaxID=110101 RepID=A0ABW2RNU8_9BACL
MKGNKQGTLPDIRHTTIFNAPIQKVWEAVSTSEGIAAWFMPNDFQPKLEHEFTLHSPYGPSRCKVTELDPPHRLAFAWGEEGWLVTFELKELEDKTQFTLIHSGWGEPEEIIAGTGEKHSVVRNKMDHGWEAAVIPRLGKYVGA